MSLSTQQLVAVVLIVFLTAVNMRGLKLGKWIQNSFTFTKTAALLGLILVGLWLGTNRESCGLDVRLVEPLGQWLESRDGLARSSDAEGPVRAAVLVRAGDDRSAVLPVRME